jgi:hypothetical protein
MHIAILLFFLHFFSLTHGSAALAYVPDCFSGTCASPFLKSAPDFKLLIPMDISGYV